MTPTHDDNIVFFGIDRQGKPPVGMFSLKLALRRGIFPSETFIEHDKVIFHRHIVGDGVA